MVTPGEGMLAAGIAVEARPVVGNSEEGLQYASSCHNMRRHRLLYGVDHAAASSMHHEKQNHKRTTYFKQ